jgi:hypothetical protein
MIPGLEEPDVGSAHGTSALIDDVLERGSFCYAAATTPLGPHVTPMVFAPAGGRLWVTTSRDSVKASAWARDDRVAGLVRAGEDAVLFTGHVSTFDLLRPESWGRSLREAPALAVAAARFTAKNARFFGGYAVDANHVPLAWTPPGRVFASLALDAVARLEGDRLAEHRGWVSAPTTRNGAERFRAVRTGRGPLEGLPADVRDRLGSAGAGALALEGPSGPVVLPARWAVQDAGIYAIVAEEVLDLATTEPGPVALTIDRPAGWRASEMIGAMVRGSAEVAVASRLVSGLTSARRIARSAGTDVAGSAIVRVSPRSLVWWRGWSSGTVALP